MMNSLTTGEWGSFTAPRSRALGGKSGMTRAKPLVLLFSPRPRPTPLQFADCLHLLLLVLLSAFLWFASLPPHGRPQLFPFTQKQPCLIDQQAKAEYPDHWMEKQACKPLT
jgi:hypothetical protein